MSAPAEHAAPALSREAYFAALARRHGAETQQKLAQARVGIAGLGGLGSAIACHLARLGVGKLVLVDFDKVDVSNLHRQQYTCAQVGMEKTEALAETLHAINPFVELELHPVKVTAENAPALFADCPIVCEAFDGADQKALLVETLLTTCPDTTIVSGSGMAGMGSANTIRTRKALEHLYLCGDGSSDVAAEGSLASPRVGVCAGHQANMVLRLILGKTEP